MFISRRVLQWSKQNLSAILDHQIQKTFTKDSFTKTGLWQLTQKNPEKTQEIAKQIAYSVHRSCCNSRKRVLKCSSNIVWKILSNNQPDSTRITLQADLKVYRLLCNKTTISRYRWESIGEFRDFKCSYKTTSKIG